jgi:hypothetical protein
MTYTQGGLIQATDYNGFASTTSGANVNGIWGVGATDKGYGQSTTLPTVSAATVVTASQWSALNSRITSMANHTNTSITSRTNPVAGNPIAILSALNTDLTNITNNRGNAAGSGTTSNTWSGSTSKVTGTGSLGSAWTITWTHTVDFGTAAQARYFWNAGGLIRIDMSKTSTGTDTDPDWNAFIATVGTFYFSGRVNGTTNTIGGTPYTGFTRSGGSGTPSPNLTTTGWYTLTPGASAITMMRLTNSTSPYTNTYVQITAAINPGSTAITFVTTWVDGGSVNSRVISGGTATTSPFAGFGTAPAVLFRYVPPSTTYLTNTWGTPTVTASVA